MADAGVNFGFQNQSNQSLPDECESKPADFCWEDYQQTTGNYGMISGTILATFIVIANCLLFFGIIFSKNNMMSQRFYHWVLSLSVLDVMFGTTLLHSWKKCFCLRNRFLLLNFPYFEAQLSLFFGKLS